MILRRKYEVQEVQNMLYEVPGSVEREAILLRRSVVVLETEG